MLFITVSQRSQGICITCNDPTANWRMEIFNGSCMTGLILGHCGPNIFEGAEEKRGQRLVAIGAR